MDYVLIILLLCILAFIILKGHDSLNPLKLFSTRKFNPDEDVAQTKPLPRHMAIKKREGVFDKPPPVPLKETSGGAAVKTNNAGGTSSKMSKPGIAKPVKMERQRDANARRDRAMTTAVPDIIVRPELRFLDKAGIYGKKVSNAPEREKTDVEIKHWAIAGNSPRVVRTTPYSAPIPTLSLPVKTGRETSKWMSNLYKTQ